MKSKREIRNRIKSLRGKKGSEETREALEWVLDVQSNEKNSPKEECCEWIKDEGNIFDREHNMWNTECGKIFVLSERTPEENEMEYCTYCGRKLKQIIVREK